MIAVPPFINSLTSDPLTRNPLASSRCPLMDWFPGFRAPEGAIATVTPGHDDRIIRLGRHGHDAGLKRQQVGEAPSVQGDCGYHLAGFDFPHLGALRLDLDGGSGNNHFFRLPAHGQRDVRSELRIDVNDEAGALVGFKPFVNDFDLIAADGQGREIVKAIGIRLGSLQHRRVQVESGNRGVRNHGSGLVRYSSRNASHRVRPHDNRKTWDQRQASAEDGRVAPLVVASKMI